MVHAEPTPLPPRADAGPRVARYRVGDRVLLGISAVVDDPAQPDVAQLALVGELCPASTPTLEEMLGGLIGDGITTVHVDLSQLHLCTAAGVNVFDRLRRELAEAGGALELVNASGVVHRVLEVAEIPHHVSPSD